ncbi:MAG: serine aminopeptidase domain-containing protein [Bacteriovoracaceae bacterium]
MKYLAYLLSLTYALPLLAQQSPIFEEKVNQFLNKSLERNLQVGCKPRIYKAKSTVPFKGTVVLHHGFTACPQQFFELSEKYLTPAGYDVLLTVLPGHGGTWDNKGHDQFDLLMGRKNMETVTEKFTSEINDIMKNAAGEKIIGGLSIGSEFAYHSVLKNPKLYQRLIMISPFFRLSNEKKEFEPGKHLFLKIMQTVLGPISKARPKLIDELTDDKPPILLRPFKGLKNSRNGWGKGCSETERQGGRAGTCEFSLDKISAIQKYGEYLLSQNPPKDIQIQFVGVRKDPTASVPHAYSLYQKIKEQSKAKVNFCLTPKSVNHSMLSRFDSPTENKYWIEKALENVSDFIIDGKQLDESSGDDDYMDCADILE